MGKTDFDEILWNAIDELMSFLGESGKYALFYHIEKRFQIKPLDIPDKLDGFHHALEALFGDGTKVIERMIAKNLYENLGLVFKEHKDWTLEEYVEYAKGGQRKDGDARAKEKQS